jgi:hypothetical protein
MFSLFPLDHELGTGVCDISPRPTMDVSQLSAYIIKRSQIHMKGHRTSKCRVRSAAARLSPHDIPPLKPAATPSLWVPSREGFGSGAHTEE